MKVRHLIVIEDNAGMRTIPLEASSYFIGRDPKNSIVLAGKSISRQHAILLRISGADPTEFSYVLIDGNLQGKRSRNGTKVNDQAFVSTRLKTGDSVDFGVDVKARYMILAAMTDAGFKQFCQNLDPTEYFTGAKKGVPNAKETMMISFNDKPAQEDLFLVRLATFPEIFPSPMFEITSRGQLTYLNPAAHDSFPDLPVMGLEHPALQGLANHIAVSNKKVLSREVQIKGKWYEQSIHYISENGLIRCCLLDVTQRKEAEEALRRRDLLSKSVAEVTTHLLTGLNQDSVIEVALEMFGQSIGVDRICISENHWLESRDELATSIKYEWFKSGESSIVDQPHRQNQIYSYSYLKRWYSLLAEDGLVASLRKDLPDDERSILFRDGILSLLVVPINVNNSFWGFLELDCCQMEYHWTPNDVANVRALAASIGAAIQRQKQEQVIEHQAYHDALTGLPNRALFHRRLEDSLERAQDGHQRVAVMFLDLDKFKTINDTLGHSVGDGLLQEVSDRLKQCIRATDTVARWGGDEFIILMPNLDNLEDAVATAKRILTVFEGTCQIDTHTLTIKTSIGIAFYPNDALEAEGLVQNADIALYQSKERGRGTYHLYANGLQSDATEIFSLHKSLQKGVAANDFLLYYQPQISAKDNQIVGLETLVRWKHPTYGLVTPNQFLALAEEASIMHDLGRWILSSAITQCLNWYRMGFENVFVSVNLSQEQFFHQDLVLEIQQLLSSNACPPQCLQLEISESIAFKDLTYTQEVLACLKQLGVRFVVDDYGAGASSLTSLSLLDITGIKLHKSLIQDMQSDRTSAAIIHALVSMAKYLNIHVTAVGVDKPETLSILKSLGCDYIQGYIISPPLPVDEATVKLQGEFHLSLPPSRLLSAPLDEARPSVENTRPSVDNVRPSTDNTRSSV